MVTYKEVVAIVGEYTNRNWETKKKYHRVGKIITKDDWKSFFVMESIPLNWDWMAWIYTPKNKQDNQEDRGSNPITPPDDDLPF